MDCIGNPNQGSRHQGNEGSPVSPWRMDVIQSPFCHEASHENSQAEHLQVLLNVFLFSMSVKKDIHQEIKQPERVSGQEVENIAPELVSVSGLDIVNLLCK